MRFLTKLKILFFNISVGITDVNREDKGYGSNGTERFKSNLSDTSCGIKI